MLKAFSFFGSMEKNHAKPFNLSRREAEGGYTHNDTFDPAVGSNHKTRISESEPLIPIFGEKSAERRDEHFFRNGLD
jgi:hypothetical protein